MQTALKPQGKPATYGKLLAEWDKLQQAMMHMEEVLQRVWQQASPMRAELHAAQQKVEELVGKQAGFNEVSKGMFSGMLFVTRTMGAARQGSHLCLMFSCLCLISMMGPV